MPLVLIQLHFLDYSTTTIEEYTIDVYVVDTLKQEVAIIPMEGLKVLVLHNFVLAENKTIYALGIKNGSIEGLEYILLYANSVLLTTMEERLLSIQIGYLGIDTDDGIGKLEHTGEGVHKAVATDGHVTTCPCLIPTIAVATEEDGCT
jgi:hypothetical protein